LLLQVLLGEVLHVTLGHRDVGIHNDLGLLLSDLNGFTEVSGLVLDLNSIADVLLLQKSNEILWKLIDIPDQRRREPCR
jgi:hypothetical protein